MPQKINDIWQPFFSADRFHKDMHHVCQRLLNEVVVSTASCARKGKSGNRICFCAKAR